MRIRACVILTKGSQILLGKYHADGEDHFVAYGGGVEGQESVVQAGIREIKEELGIDLDATTFLGVIDNIFPNNGKQIRELGIYFSSNISNINEMNSLDQIVTPVWIQLDDIGKYNVHPKALVNLITGKISDYFLAGESGSAH